MYLMIYKSHISCKNEIILVFAIICQCSICYIFSSFAIDMSDYDEDEF